MRVRRFRTGGDDGRSRLVTDWAGSDSEGRVLSDGATNLVHRGRGRPIVRQPAASKWSRKMAFGRSLVLA